MRKILTFGFLFAAASGALTITSCKDEPALPTPPAEYSIEVTAGPNGSVEARVDGRIAAKALEGATITLTATPDEGYLFDEWTVTSGDVQVSGNPATLAMPAADMAVEATFKPEDVDPVEKYSITISENPGGIVSATVEGRATAEAGAGTEITLTATPDEGYDFVKWILVGATPSSDTAANTMFIMPEGDVAVSAEFDPHSTPEEGVVINGVRWATRNVDTPGTFAETFEDAGMFYQWGRKTGWSSDDPLTNSDGGTVWDATNTPGGEWTSQNDPTPEGWRLPTVDDFRSLCDTKSVTAELLITPAGYKFTDKTTGNSVFFPAAGGRSLADGTLAHVNGNGYYWSSTPSGNSNGYLMVFYGTGIVSPASNIDRGNGFSVRPVAE